MAAIIGYDEPLAHLLQGGADALLVPSRFEPCGLTQMCALRYGAIPVVARVGGLADTVVDASEMALAAKAGTGVQFAPVTRDALTTAIERTLALWRDRAGVAAAAVARDGGRRELEPSGQALRGAVPRTRAGVRREPIARGSPTDDARHRHRAAPNPWA